MQFAPSENSGLLFKNDNKKEERHADYTGKVNINGTEFWINGWIKTGRSGNKFMSLSFKQIEGSAKPKLKVVGGNDPDPNDSIPF